MDLSLVARGCVGSWLEDIKVLRMMRINPTNIRPMPPNPRSLLIHRVKSIPLIELPVEVIDVHWYAPTCLLHVLQSTHAH